MPAAASDPTWYYRERRIGDIEENGKRITTDGYLESQIADRWSGIRYATECQIFTAIDVLHSNTFQGALSNFDYRNAHRAALANDGQYITDGVIFSDNSKPRLSRFSTALR